MAIAPDSNTVVVTGGSTGSTGLDATTLAYNRAGRKLWTRYYDDPDHENDITGTLAIDPNGTAAIVAGSTERTSRHGTYNFLTIAYSLV